MKILSIVGARPQFVKEAMIQRALREYPDMEEVLVHTGQHYDENMSGVFFDVLSMEKPKYNLGIHGKTHGAMTGEMLIKLEEVMMEEKPDVVLLYGDTDSTLAGALAAAKLAIPVAHVEAGLRQEPKDMPEEINRVLTDRISTHLFVPTQNGMENLRREGLSDRALLTGDVMYDIFLVMKPYFEEDYVHELGLTPGEYLLMTMHRDFNVDHREKLEKILTEIHKVAQTMPVVWPLHPRTKGRVEEFGFSHLLEGVTILPPIDYLKLMGLTLHCRLVLTDSGGYQKEAYFAEKPVLILMPDTSWRELLEVGNALVSPEEIFEKVFEVQQETQSTRLYGHGDAAGKIVDCLHREGK